MQIVDLNVIIIENTIKYLKKVKSLDLELDKHTYLIKCMKLTF